MLLTLIFSIKMPSRIEILRAAPNHMVFCAKNTLFVFPKHMTATHHAAVLGHAHFLTHKSFGAFIYLLHNGVVLLKPFRRYFLIIFSYCFIKNHYHHTNQIQTCHRCCIRHSPSLRERSSCLNHLRDDGNLHSYCENPQY